MDYYVGGSKTGERAFADKDPYVGERVPYVKDDPHAGERVPYVKDDPRAQEHARKEKAPAP